MQGSWLAKGEALEPLHQTGLHMAVEAGDAGLAEILLQAGADPNVVRRGGGQQSCLGVPCTQLREDAELAELLVKRWSQFCSVGL